MFCRRREHEINRQIADTKRKSETTLYSEMRRSHPVFDKGLPMGLARTVEGRASHGTHMLDVAAGARSAGPATGTDPDVAMRDIPIIGVQLPPQSVDDTSGMRLEIHVVQALRWMISEAKYLNVRTLVVNLSYGSAAGSKDGTSFVEQQMVREIERAAASGLTVHLVLPFGNEYDSRLVARSALPAKTKTAIEFLLPRADETPTFFEVSSTDKSFKLSSLKVSLVAPDGSRSVSVTIPRGTSRPVRINAKQVGIVYNLDTPEPTYLGRIDAADKRAAYRPKLVFAFTPTTEPRKLGFNDKDLGLAPSGRWKMHFIGNETKDCTLAFQIQRDDSAFGYQRPGQQATFDRADAYDRSALFRDHTALGESMTTHRGAQITHNGTHTAYVGAGSKHIHAVGAARSYLCHSEPPNQPAPAHYTSQGSSRPKIDPSCSVVIETSPAHPGVLAAGTVSGGTVRLSGTSVAAAGCTRELLLGNTPGKGITKGQDRLGQMAYEHPERGKRG